MTCNDDCQLMITASIRMIMMVVITTATLKIATNDDGDGYSWLGI